MKGATLILSALALCHLSESKSIICSEGSLIPHKDCSQFLQCVDGQLISLKCPEGLHFDAHLSRCNTPRAAKCSQTEAYNNEILDLESLGASDPRQAQTICAKLSAHGKLVAHESCNKFYKCLFGKTVTYNCPLNFLFNIEKHQCDWSDRVNCGTRRNDLNKENEDTLNDADPKKICAAYNSGGTLLVHEYCNQFYNCSKGIPKSFTCPFGYLYNRSTKYCDKAENVNCETRILPIMDDNAFKTTTAPTQTISNKRYLRELDSDLNLSNRICAIAHLDGLAISHENCNQYYRCLQGILVAFECPNVLLYNPIKEKCDLPENVECEDRHIPDYYTPMPKTKENYSKNRLMRAEKNTDITKYTTVTTRISDIYDDPDTATDVCSVKGSEGTLIAHPYCNHFYKCFQGQPVALICPTTLLYNPEKRYCDWPTLVNCGDRLVPNYQGKNSAIEIVLGSVTLHENVDDSGEFVSICASDHSEGKFTPHRFCNLFYKCLGGRPVAMKCPEKLLYDPFKFYCDWPLIVNCQKRPIYEFKIEIDTNTNETVDDTIGDDGDNESDYESNTDNDYTDDKKRNNGTSELNENYDHAEIVDSHINNPHEFCARPDSDGKFIAHEICTKFYKCSEGRAMPFSCPNSLLYNTDRKFCDWPRNVDCGERSLGAETILAYKTMSNISQKNCKKLHLDGRLIPHRKCNKFYKCTDGELVAINCPKGLVFNPKREVCDWPKNVTCGRKAKSSKGLSTNKNISR